MVSSHTHRNPGHAMNPCVNGNTNKDGYFRCVETFKVDRESIVLHHLTMRPFQQSAKLTAIGLQH